jgi:hypothetical protein
MPLQTPIKGEKVFVKALRRSCFMSQTENPSSVQRKYENTNIKGGKDHGEKVSGIF